MKNYYPNFPKVKSSDILLCPANGTEPKDIQFEMIQNREKQQLLY